MSSPRRPVDTPPAVLAAASAAACKPDELLHLTPATLAEIKMPLIDRVAVERHLGALRSARPDIAAVQEKAEERKLYPWKVDEERALRLTSRFGSEHAAATAGETTPLRLATLPRGHLSVPRRRVRKSWRSPPSRPSTPLKPATATIRVYPGMTYLVLSISIFIWVPFLAIYGTGVLC